MEVPHQEAIQSSKIKVKIRHLRELNYKRLNPQAIFPFVLLQEWATRVMSY
jgi:hypothetical protein